MKKGEKELLERLAELEHQQWCHIINYLNSLSLNQREWKLSEYSKGLAGIDYKWLSEKDKEQDRIWARKVLEVLKDG